MATKYWTGGAEDSTFSTAANWSDSTTPANGDVLVFANDPSSGVDFIAGGDYSGFGSCTLVVGPNWSGNFGSSTTALKLKLTKVEYSGQGNTVNLEAHPTVTTTEVSITDTGAGAIPFRLSGTNTITLLRVTDGKGAIEINGPRTVTTVDVIGASRLAVVDMISGGTISGTTARISGGTVKIKGDYTNCEVSGQGVLEVSGTAEISTLDIYGGTCKWNTEGTTSGVSSRLAVYNGMFDATDCVATTTTISNTELYSSGSIDERNGLEGISWDGGITVSGGSLSLDPGRQITVT